jgi:tetrapyrrole methylase family protein/MazG family protein
MVSRHPHVFGDVKVADSDEVLRNWEKNKSKDSDGEHRSILAGVPRHLPALQKAQRVQSRAALVGFDWKDVKDVLAKVEEELAETKEAMQSEDKEHICEEIGDLLFSVVNLIRFYEMSAEDALNKTIAKFIGRFEKIERQIHGQGRELTDCSLEEMDAIWEEAKGSE